MNDPGALTATGAKLQRQEKRGFAALHRDVWHIVMTRPAFFLGVPALFMFLPDLLVEQIADRFTLDPMAELRFYFKAGFWETLLFGTLVSSVLLAGVASLKRGGRIAVGPSIREGIGAWGRVMSAYWSVTWRASLGLILLVVPGIYLWVRYSLAIPAAFFAGCRGAEAIDASADRVKGRAWKIFLLSVGALLLYLPGTMAITMALPLSVGPVVQAAAMIPANMVGSLFLVALTLLYFDGAPKEAAGDEEAEELSSPMPVHAVPSGRAGVVIAGLLSYGSVIAAFFVFGYFAMAPIDRGDAAYERGDYEAALEEYRVALEWDPEDPYVHYSMAFAYHELGQLQEALESIEAALAIQPDDPEFNEAMVDLLLAQDKAPEARRHVEEASRAGLIDDVLRDELERWIEEHEQLDAEEEAAQRA